MACAVPVYQPRDAEHTVLHRVIGEHLEAFLRTAAEAGDGEGLSQFVEREFREFLACGIFEHGEDRKGHQERTQDPFTRAPLRGRR